MDFSQNTQNLHMSYVYQFCILFVYTKDIINLDLKVDIIYELVFGKIIDINNYIAIVTFIKFF